MALPCTAWVQLNRLRSGVGRLRSCLHKYAMAPSAARECGAEEQTVDHVILHCPVHRLPHGAHGLMILDDETVERLLNTCPQDLVQPRSGLKELAQTMKKNCDVIGELHVSVEPQTRTQFSANGTTELEIRKLEMNFAPQCTLGYLPVHNGDVVE